MTVPNFLVIGAARSGTDALYSYLGQHPQIFMSPNKEPNFFVTAGRPEIPYRGPGDRKILTWLDMWVSTPERYQALFAGVNGEKAIGEASTWYLYEEGAAERIKSYLPGIRLVAILRNPVDRAYSAYTMMLRDARETLLDFSRALAMEAERVSSNWEPIWHYQRMGFYHTQLERYHRLFDPSQIQIVLYDDFNQRPGSVMRELFGFLEVDQTFEPVTSARLNVSMVPEHPAYHRLVFGPDRFKDMIRPLLPAAVRWRLKRSLATKLVRPEPLAPDIRRQLVELYRPDIERLQELLKRDLSTWLK